MKPSVHITFAPHLQRHVACPAQTLVAQTIAEAIDCACAIAPPMRHYVCDDQGHIRKHVAVFINGVMLTDRAATDTPLCDGDQIHIIQALTGG
jgi:sulfur-carrier protein